ncbi:MAG: formylglycine-generating enzyme family protein [Planctomycetia bacterium]|nr:formylglycine-generating enzyme family protein [Candidatus Brocadia sp.]QOJ05697.1 MAG: formylglycine-generating enzyme family protein [Planctomycetia bacterium]TVL95271.1 MAG: serine/threonine protein kinase [Candidatus Brocadia sp. BL1]HQU31220.1 formylglycine-generating enzyme family protein [Candidatus Brocadia sapporoensis]
MIRTDERKQDLPEDMILIAEGLFFMGSTKQDITNLLELDHNIEAERLENEIPQHKVYLNAYLIDKYPVTNAQYKKFIESGGYMQKTFWSDDGWQYIVQTKPLENNELDGAFHDQADCPVVNISWYEAEAFASWAGKRLPTEAEWEKAARGTDGRIYPWGNEFDKTRLNCAEAKIEKPTAVTKYPQGQSIYGCFDMAGNVWEWTADWYDSQYYRYTSDKNPQGPTMAEKNPYFGRPEEVGISIYDLKPSPTSKALSGCKVLRGGSWNGSGIVHIRCSNRDYDEPTYKNDTIGFRCAKSPE